MLQDLTRAPGGVGDDVVVTRERQAGRELDGALE